MVVVLKLGVVYVKLAVANWVSCAALYQLMVYPAPGSVAVRVTDPVPQSVTLDEVAEPGNAFTVTVVAALVAEQLLLLVTVTV